MTLGQNVTVADLCARRMLRKQRKILALLNSVSTTHVQRLVHVYTTRKKTFLS
jgi:hypothetical protein